MPVAPLAIAALNALPAAAGFASNLINAGSQKRLNAQQQAWNEKMADTTNQRNIDFWNMQNEYNNPQEQMKRLQAAGLNPNLVYGNGAVANSATSIKAEAPQSWNPKAPEYDLGSPARQGIDRYFDTQMKQAQLKNLEAQNTVIQEEALLKQSQRINLDQSNDFAATRFPWEIQDRPYQAEMRKEDLRRLQIGNQSNFDENERRNIMLAPTLDAAIQRVSNMKIEASRNQYDIQRIQSETNRIRQDVRLKALDENLKKLGIQPSDPIYLRIITQLLNNVYK